MSPARADGTAPDSGFSLVEALVALFVFAVACVGLVELQSQSIGSLSRAETRALAGIVAQNHLVEATASAAIPDLGRREGVERLASRDWRWAIEVAPTAEPSARQVTVIVADARRPAAPLATLHGFLIVPAAATAPAIASPR